MTYTEDVTVIKHRESSPRDAGSYWWCHENIIITTMFSTIWHWHSCGKFQIQDESSEEQNSVCTLTRHKSQHHIINWAQATFPPSWIHEIRLFLSNMFLYTTTVHLQGSSSQSLEAWTAFKITQQNYSLCKCCANVVKILFDLIAHLSCQQADFYTSKECSLVVGTTKKRFL